MNYEEALAFAKEWITSWNRRDVEAVIAHFGEEAEFVSPKAQQFVGRTSLEGKAAIRNYWETALGQISDLRFVLDRVLLDDSGRQLAIVYAARLNQKTTRAIEMLTFDERGLVVRGEAFYGVPTE